MEIFPQLVQSQHPASWVLCHHAVLESTLVNKMNFTERSTFIAGEVLQSLFLS
jgi:tRNA A22 N-methylase